MSVYQRDHCDEEMAKLHEENARLNAQLVEMYERIIPEEIAKGLERLTRERDEARAKVERVEELERALKSADESITRNRLDRDRWRERAEAAEAKLARCVEAASDVADDWTEVKARLERYLAGGIDIWEDDIRAALERVEDYDAIRKERDYYAIEFSALTSNVPPGAKKTLLDTIRSLRQRVEELERAPRCCADTIPPGCRTCRCADAAEAKLAKVVTLLTNVEWSDNPWNAIKAALAAAKGEE